MDLFVIQIDQIGFPSSLKRVNSHKEGIDLLVQLAKENEVKITRKALQEDLGFSVDKDEATGCWLIAAD
jgi:hypothetical protein